MSKENINIEIVPLSHLNVYEAFGVAKKIFPCNSLSVGTCYFASFLPKSLLPSFSKVVTSVTLGQLDYFVAREINNGNIVGVTGLYSIEDKKEVWVGWFGIDPYARGYGYGNILLDWTIQTAKDKGFDILRLWTSTGAEYTRANEMYAFRGFWKQEIGVDDPDCHDEQLVLQSLGLHGQKPTAFCGNLQEAFLGEFNNKIEKGRKSYQEHYLRLQ